VLAGLLHAFLRERHPIFRVSHKPGERICPDELQVLDESHAWSTDRFMAAWRGDPGVAALLLPLRWGVHRAILSNSNDVPIGSPSSIRNDEQYAGSRSTSASRTLSRQLARLYTDRPAARCVRQRPGERAGRIRFPAVSRILTGRSLWSDAEPPLGTDGTGRKHG